MTPVDFRSFLPTGEPVVLPYFGGTRVEAADRRHRLSAALEPGWFRFRIEGRRAVPIEPADPIDLTDRPAVRGHWAEGWLFSSGREVDRVGLPPAEEPAPLARATGRRWHSGDLLLESIDFEDEAEVEARQALEDGRPIAAVRGAVPSLRAAFGFALAAAVGRELSVPVSPREASGRVLDIAERGREAAVALCRALADERARAAAVQADVLQRHQIALAAEQVRRSLRVRTGNPVERADAALEAAGARMLSARRLDDRMLEVRFQLDGERYVCVAHMHTLQILDAGICLSGADRMITLDSLPSVIREAIEVDHLNITRRA